MNYKNKYLKYKNKYLTLKKQIGGGEKFFELYTVDSDTNLYHGSFNKVSGNINVPAYFTIDPLQALGHLISTATKFDNLKNDKILEGDIIKISSCYPIIYNYKTNKNITLLKMKVGFNKYNDSFGVLFDKKLIKFFLDKLGSIKKIEILTNFRNKIANIGIYLSEKEKINITEDNFFWVYCVIFDIYINNCKSGCFAGWSNTPGYYLLSNINYDAYFKSIFYDIINEDMTVDGIYVENDQNEIILFNNTDMYDTPKINFILPFYIETIEDAKSFIINYDKTVEEFLKNNEESKADNNKQIAVINLLKKFNHIDELGTKKWNFDWFKTYCENYDPYEKLDKFNCTNPEFADPDKEKCVKRFPANPKNIGLYDYDYDLDCEDFLSSKLSILDIETHSNLLKEWIDIIKNNIFSEEKLKLFENNLICKNSKITLDRIL
jgi:hypothetical protein